MVVISKRLDEMEATLANITNIISTTFPSHEQIEATRQEIFNALSELKYNINTIRDLTDLIEQRINKYV